VRLRGDAIDVGLTGATGALGACLLPLLLADDEVTRVRSVARRELPCHDKLVHTRADLCDPAARVALRGVDVLYHLGFQLWRANGRRDLGPVNVAGTRNVLAAEPGRVVLASSAAVYGAWPDNPLPITEAHVPRPNAEVRYASDKLDAERLCAEAAPGVSLRLCAVLGRHADRRVKRSAIGYRLAVPAIRGVNQALQFLDEDDAARALHAAGRSPATGTYNVATEDWLTEADIASIAGGRVVRLPRRALLAASEAALRLRLLPFGADRATMLDGPLALDPSAAASALGWRPARSSVEVLTSFLRHDAA
jgi:nucleoside-diphosphate-sugar epimerase